jgi:hypothetical protein
VSRRRCSKPSCNGAAVSTLTYVYADSTAVLGPLATYAEPHCYDLCDMHSERLTAPRGWEVVRITPDPDALKPTSDDLEALANAVREAARPRYQSGDVEQAEAEASSGSVEVARKGHLRMLTTVEDTHEFGEAPDPESDLFELLDEFDD